MNRPLYTTLLCTVLAISAHGQQNVVPNCSFEQRTQCPTNISNITADCASWYAFTNGTSDYFNTCHVGILAGVPLNFLGYQLAAHGQAYAGIINYNGSIDYKEYIATPITPLRIGASYEVSISVSRADSVSYAANDLGVLFIDQGYAFKPGTGRLTMVPQIDYTNYGIITDNINWTRVTKSFVADSAYQRMVIGGFKPYTTMPLTYIGPANFAYAYYYIDSVVVRKTSTIFYQFTDTLLCAGDTFSIPCSTDTSFHAGLNNIFYVQLSDVNGNFNSAAMIGSILASNGGNIFCTIPSSTPAGKGYRLRVISTSPADTTVASMSIGIGTPVSKPIASNNGPTCINGQLNLHATTTTTSPFLKWSWKGPNNFNTTQQNPTIWPPTINNNGAYIVTANIFGCEAKDTTNVVIIPLDGPGAWVSANSNAPVCAGDTLKLTSSNTTANSVYSWTGPNSFTAATQNVSIPNPGASAAGLYTVTASLNGCTIMNTTTVAMKPGPQNFTASDNSPLCAGSTYNLSSSSTSTGITYSWIGPNSFTSSAASPSISNVNSTHGGDYIITITLNSSNCKVKDTLTLTVNPLPVKPVISSNTPMCSGGNLNLSATTTTTGIDYVWTGPNSFTATTQSPSVTNVSTAASGDYIVTTIITATGCSAKDTETVLIKPTPVVTASGSTPVCEGNTIYLSATVTPSGTFSWIGPNSFTASVQNPSIGNADLGAGGDYIVTATLNGCIARDTTTVQVKARPITPSVSSNAPVCIGSVLTLTANSDPGATYSWTGPTGFTSALQNPSRNVTISNDAGIYSVLATLNGCTSLPGNVNVSLTPTPFVVIYAIPGDTICQGSTVSYTALPANISANATYKWTKNSSPSVLSTTNTFVSTGINNNDIIRCELTEPVKCGSTYIDTSNEIKMTVLPWLAPSVSITCNPTTPLAPYELVTFTAYPVNGGNSPKYQWRKNLTDQIGANSYTWGTMQIDDKDSVSVIMISDYKCPQPKTATSNKIKVTVLTGVDDVKGNGNISLYPNPNSGLFTIKGNVNSNKEVTIQIVNAAGQLVYETTCLPNNKELNTQINVEHLAKGVYSLRIKTGTINTIKFSIE